MPDPAPGNAPAPAPAGQPAAPAPPAAAQPPTPPPAAGPPPAAPLPPAAKATPPAADPAWLPARLQSAAKATLTRHGVESEEQLTADLAELKQLREGKLTTQQKLEAQAAEGAQAVEALGAHAKAQMASLTDKQREGVMQAAGEDAGRQLRTIDAMRPTWVAPPPAAGDPPGHQAGQPGAPGPPAAAPPVAPATTTQTQPAPAGGSPPPPTDNYARYKAMREQNPILAGQFRDMYVREIAAAEAAEAQAAATG